MQVVHGRGTGEDELVDTVGRVAACSPSPTRPAGTASTATSCSTSTGSFGYTVRIMPRNDLLASPAELGVVALP